MHGHDIIVIGASMGGVKALQALVRDLDPGLRAAIFVVLHVDPRSRGLLAGILAKCGRVPATMAVDGEPIARGEIRVAPPDHHLLLESGMTRLVHGPKENRSRPAIDTLFRSAALAYGPRVIGVVLTGRLDDGTAGLWTIQRAGGITVVQDPGDAEFDEMPKNASDATVVDHSVPLAQMAALLAELVATPALVSEGTVPKHEEERYVPGVVYVCPDCKGPLREIETGNDRLVRFECLVGHAFSMATLLEGHAEATEAALWSAVVSLEHQAMFAERAARHAATRDDATWAEALTAEAKRAREQGSVIRGLLEPSSTRRPHHA